MSLCLEAGSRAARAALRSDLRRHLDRVEKDVRPW